jgi:hypothetical protein
MMGCLGRAFVGTLLSGELPAMKEAISNPGLQTGAPRQNLRFCLVGRASGAIGAAIALAGDAVDRHVANVAAFQRPLAPQGVAVRVAVKTASRAGRQQAAARNNKLNNRDYAS